jgi:hypothetical protein
VNCSKIQRNTSSILARAILTFCRHSPQLIARLYYVFITAISRGRYLHERAGLVERLASFPRSPVLANFRLPTIRTVSWVRLSLDK